MERVAESFRLGPTHPCAGSHSLHPGSAPTTLPRVLGGVWGPCGLNKTALVLSGEAPGLGSREQVQHPPMGTAHGGKGP